MRSWLFEYGNVMVALAVLGTFTFAASYAVFFSWRRTSAGRSLMYFVLSLLALADQVLASLIDPNYPFRDLLRAAAYTAIVIAVWRMVYTLWRSWKHTSIEIEPRKKSDQSEEKK